MGRSHIRKVLVRQPEMKDLRAFSYLYYFVRFFDFAVFSSHIRPPFWVNAAPALECARRL